MSHLVSGSTQRLSGASFLLAGILCAESAETSRPVFQVIGLDPDSGTARAVIAERAALAHTTQLDFSKRGRIVSSEDAATQTRQVLDNLELALEPAGASLAGAVKLNVYVTHAGIVPDVKRALKERFTGPAHPAVSFVETALSERDALVAMDAVAVSRRPPSEAATVSLGSSFHLRYTAAHVALLPAGGVVYVAGQAQNGDRPDAVKETLASLEATLKHLGLARKDIVQLKAFLRPMEDRGKVELEFLNYFGLDPLPPLVLVEWISNQPVEIELIAAAPAKLGVDTVEFITPPALKASPIFSRVARVNHGKLIFFSGLYGTTPDNGEAQVREIFDSLGGLLKQTDSDFKHLVKATYYVSTDSASAKLNELRPNYYDPQRPPAASKAMVKGVAQDKRGITLDMIAVTRE
jgi:enamine deaminase RidA (YjgF/YER057c/UK114 family)